MSSIWNNYDITDDRRGGGGGVCIQLSISSNLKLTYEENKFKKFQSTNSSTWQHRNLKYKSQRIRFVDHGEIFEHVATHHHLTITSFSMVLFSFEMLPLTVKLATLYVYDLTYSRRVNCSDGNWKSNCETGVMVIPWKQKNAARLSNISSQLHHSRLYHRQK